MEVSISELAGAGILRHKFARRIRFRDEKMNDKERILAACLWLRQKIAERYYKTMTSDVCIRVGFFGDDYIQARASILISFDYFVVVKK